MALDTDIQAGSWIDGYQAVSPAPVEFIKGDRSRYIDGKTVKGAWSDPWWMYDPDHGWAVARFWRSKAQRIFMWPEKRSEDFPALEERELTPWSPAGQQPAEAEEVAAVQVWDVSTDETREVTVPEAAAGMVRYARTLGPGTPACGEVERQAVELLRGAAPAPDAQDMSEAERQMARAAAVREQARQHREAQLAAARERKAQLEAERTETTGAGHMDETAGSGTVAVPAAAPVTVPGATVATTDGEPRIPGDQLLDLLRDQWFGFYARLPSPAALDAVTLWAAHCWMRDETGVLVFRATPRLCLLSSEPGSGKGLVLELLMDVVPNCYGLDLEPTKSGLIHTINDEHATVCIDESDILFGAGQRKSDVRAVLNGGTYRRGTILNGKGGKTNRVPVFGPIALAGLDVMEKDTGDALDALMTRFVKIRMVKMTGDARPPKRTPQAYDAAGQAKVWLERWAAQVRDEVAGTEPEFPEGMDGRAEDIYGPLGAVALAAGGEWPERFQAVCRELALGKPESQDVAAEFAEFADGFGVFR